MHTHSGYICVSLRAARLAELNWHRTAYTVTVDYKHGTTTGISAHDRALTVRALAAASPSSSPSPGFGWLLLLGPSLCYWSLCWSLCSDPSRTCRLPIVVCGFVRTHTHTPIARPHLWPNDV